MSCNALYSGLKLCWGQYLHGSYARHENLSVANQEFLESLLCHKNVGMIPGLCSEILLCFAQPAVYENAEEMAEESLKKMQQREEDDRFYGNNSVSCCMSAAS